MAISSGPCLRAQEWSRVIYASYCELDGLYYSSSMHANRPAAVLYERADDALPAAPIFHRPLREPALLEALDADRLRAGLDVYLDEPAMGSADWSSAVAGHRNVYGTHHIGSSTDQSQDAIGAEVVRVLEAFEAGELVNCVNKETA